MTGEVFEAAMGMTEVRNRSRSGSGANVKRPATSASIRCDLSLSARSAVAGCRQSRRAGTPYYVRQPSLNWGRDAKRQSRATHPTI